MIQPWVGDRFETWCGQLADPSVVSVFFGGGPTRRRDPSQGTPKNENSTDLGYFWEEPKFTFEKNEKMGKNVRLANGQGTPQIIEHMTEVDMFYVKGKCALSNA